MKMRRTFFLLLLIALILGGCQIVGMDRNKGAETPETPPVTPADVPAPTLIRETEPPPTGTPLPTPTYTVEVETVEPVEEVSPLDFSSASDLSHLDSYRLTQRALRVSEEEKSVIELTREVSRPRVVRLAFAFTNGGTGHMEIIRAADTSYVTFGEEWRSTSLPPEAIVGERNWMPDPADFLEGVGEYVSEGRIGDLRARHYHYDQDTLGTGGHAAEVVEGSADVWVSTEHQVYLKILLHWKGLKETGRTITYQMESVVHDVNAPVGIEVPAAADRPGIPYDVPLMPGAREVSVRDDLITFDVGVSPQDVMSFYTQHMPVRSWRLTESRMPLLLRFVKRGRAVSVLIRSQGGVTTVVLVQEGGKPEDM
ncbi:MAG: hypothetical protein ACQEQT_00035 [Chloroflexota bacterium]